jgi:zinc transporter ZupT
LGITFLHLLPETYEMGGILMGKIVLLGFFVQIILDQFSEGIEHGHIHKHSHNNSILSVMIGIGIHAFLEGMPLVGFKELAAHDHNHLLMGVLLHKPPEAFALILLLLHSGFSKQNAFIALCVFILLSPLGALAASAVADIKIYGHPLIAYLMALVIGSFLHIGTTILYENNATPHHISRLKAAAILGGGLLSLLTAH